MLLKKRMLYSLLMHMFSKGLLRDLGIHLCQDKLSIQLKNYKFGSLSMCMFGKVEFHHWGSSLKQRYKWSIESLRHKWYSLLRHKSHNVQKLDSRRHLCRYKQSIELKRHTLNSSLMYNECRDLFLDLWNNLKLYRSEGTQSEKHIVNSQSRSILNKCLLKY